MRGKNGAVSMLVVALALAAGAAACHKDGASGGNGAPRDGAASPDAGGGAGGAAGADARGDADARPTISVPVAWMRPADCHGVGELCPGAGCPGDGAICQLFGYVCTPGGKYIWATGDAPYCLAFACMTYEQASCFCTGPAGAMYPSCKYGPPAVAGLCAPEESSCADLPCCSGLDCIALGPTKHVCYQRCASAASCDTGCCTDRTDTGDLECGPAAACQTPCTKRGGACDNPSTCCNGTCVIGTTNPEWLGCRPECLTNTDCASGCCQLFQGGLSGFCTSPGYCGCGIGCAAGSDCLTFDGTNYGCFKQCTQPDACGAQCCTQHLQNKDYGVCVDCTGGCTPACPANATCLVGPGGTGTACYQNCTQPSDCPSLCCTQNLPGKSYGSCVDASMCGL